MNKLRSLLAVHSLPFCTPSGKVIDRIGYDPETGIYFHAAHDYSPNVQDNPTADQVRAAVVRLVAPFRGYQWASPDDAAAMVCAVLTAIARPVLDICPAVLVEAAAQGSGKTKLAMALGSLMTGRREGVLPFSGLDDEELRKQIIAGVLTGQPFHCLDNITGFYRSPTLAAVLTAGRVQGRVLGASKTVDATIRALFCLTGNNAALDADLMRRTMRLRVESGANPTARRFDFDPVTEALRDRLKIAEAGCLIWRSYFNAGAPRNAGDDAGGFTDWSNLCRQPVLWLAREGLADSLCLELGDPAASMLADPAIGDPALEAHTDLLRGLNALADGGDFSSADVLQWFCAGEHVSHNEPHKLVRDATRELLGLSARDEPSSRKLSWMMKDKRDRVAGGLALRARDNRATDSRLWRVVSVG